MTHKLSEFFKGYKLADALSERELSGISSDSRQIQPGYVFVAYKGVAVDGYDYIPQAIEKGAVAIVCESVPEACRNAEAAWIVVDDALGELGELASRWYGHPSSKMTLIGVTGTNGKTTTATLLYEMARKMGHKAGLLSTVANKIEEETIPASHTTPDPIEMNALMAKMVEKGCTFCAMEVSSHACHQKRIAGLKFAGAVFTNLTRDHLDYHKTFANYIAAKKSFFDNLPADAFALVNADDKNGAVMLQNTKASRFDYALMSPANFKGRIIEDRIDGMLLSLQGAAKGENGAPKEVETAFAGRFNAYNLTAVYAACLLLGWNRDKVLEGISELRPVAGRMQTLHSPTGVTAIVDYAHTPDALANVLQAISESTRGAIITVTGAGGNRDAGKRPLMGAEAARFSDAIVITSDNPRNEDAAEIARQILEGIPAEKRGLAVIVLDRAEAIRQSIEMANPGDVVLIAGKGHENYQIIGDEKRHFDDCEEVRKAFHRLK